HPRQLRPGTDDEDAGRIHTAALDRDAAVGLVRRDRDVGEAERQPLKEHDEAVEQSAAAKLRFEKLRIQVVMIEDEARAEQELEDSGDQENGVRRIACVNDVEA